MQRVTGRKRCFTLSLSEALLVVCVNRKELSEVRNAVEAQNTIDLDTRVARRSELQETEE